jgi:hypothetical protein
MKPYLRFVTVLATSLGLANLALAGGGGGGGHFGGGGAHAGGGAHFERGGRFSGGEHLGRGEAGRGHERGFRFEGRRDFDDGHDRLFRDQDRFRSAVPGDWGVYGTPWLQNMNQSSADFAAEDERVRSVQKVLTRAGYYHYAIDGFWGLTTQNAVEEYEKANNLPVTGTIDETLLRSLGLQY